MSEENLSVPTAKDRLIHGVKITAIMAGVMAVAIAMFWKPFSSNVTNMEGDVCQENLMMLHAAALKYAEEHNGLLPSEKWDIALAKYLGSEAVLSCPRQRRMDPRTSGYALNQEVAGKRLSSLAPGTILFFDSRGTDHGLITAPDDSPRPGRHRNGRANNVVYVNGSAAAVDPH